MMPKKKQLVFNKTNVGKVLSNSRPGLLDLLDLKAIDVRRESTDGDSYSSVYVPLILDTDSIADFSCLRDAIDRFYEVWHVDQHYRCDSGLILHNQRVCLYMAY